MTSERFEKFTEIFENIFKPQKGRFGYDEGDGANPFTVYLSLEKSWILIAGEGQHFHTPDVPVAEILFVCDDEENLKMPYMEFRNQDGRCLWFIRGDEASRRDYERLLFICDEYNSHHKGEHYEGF